MLDTSPVNLIDSIDSVMRRVSNAIHQNKDEEQIFALIKQATALTALLESSVLLSAAAKKTAEAENAAAKQKAKEKIDSRRKGRICKRPSRVAK